MCRSLMAVCVPGFNENVVLSAYADDVIVFTRNQRDVDILTSIISDFTTTSEALAVGEWRGGLPVLPQNLTCRRDGLKYLGVFLGKETKVQKNVTEKVEGKLKKWKWLVPQMSYRGRVWF